MSLARSAFLLVLVISATSLGAPPTAELIRTIPFNRFAASEVYPADIDGDGKLELLCLQSPGIYQSDVFIGTRSEIPAAERKTFCLTAITQEGNVLWQFGEPNLKVRSAGTHVADQMLFCGTIGDTRKREIAVIRESSLYILDAATGAQKRSVDLKADNYCIVLPIQTRNGTRLLVQNTERAYPPYQYGSPTLIYDANLNLLATIPEALGSGHSPRMADLNGEGDEELLLGYDAYDSRGVRLWRVNDLGKVDPINNHVDQLQIGDFGTPPFKGIVYAGSFNVVMATAEGKLLWMHPFGHPQHVVLGDFRDGDKRASIAIYGCRDLVAAPQKAFLEKAGLPIPPNGNRNNIAFMNSAGEIVGLIFPPALKYHSGEGILLYPQGCPDGSDAIILRDWEWPEALNMAGQRVFDFARPQVEPPADENYPHGPCPDGYGVRIADFDQDGRAEVLIHDQTFAWIYKPPYPATGASHTHDKLKPITGQGNYGLQQ
jgi:hypothetical protein